MILGRGIAVGQAEAREDIESGGKRRYCAAFRINVIPCATAFVATYFISTQGLKWANLG